MFVFDAGSRIQMVSVSQCDRWSICHRLQELVTACHCPADGSLRVEVNHWIDAVLVRSTAQLFTASRTDLVDWLQRYWNVRD